MSWSHTLCWHLIVCISLWTWLMPCCCHWSVGHRFIFPSSSVSCCPFYLPSLVSKTRCPHLRLCISSFRVLLSHHAPSCLLDNIRVMLSIWRLIGNIIRTALCWIVWHNVHSLQHTYVSSSYRSNRLGLSNWDPYTVRRGSWLELYVVTWWSGSGGIQAWS